MTQLAAFDDAWLAGFRQKSGITDEAALQALRDELFTIGQHYRQIIETTPCDLKGSPFNKTLTQRGDWVDVNVVRPTAKLLAALSESNRAWFSTWPYEHEFKEFPDRERVRTDLQKVLEFSQRLLRNLRGEQEANAATNQELRFYIFKDIVAAVRRHLPGFTPEQGVYQQLADEKTKRFVADSPKRYGTSMPRSPASTNSSFAWRAPSWTTPNGITEHSTGFPGDVCRPRYSIPSISGNISSPSPATKGHRQ